MADRSKVKVPKVTPVDLTRLPVKFPKIEIDRTSGGEIRRSHGGKESR